MGCRFNTLRVDTTRRRGQMPTLTPAFVACQHLEEIVPNAGPTPTVEIAIDRLPTAKRFGQQSPLAAGFGQI